MYIGLAFTTFFQSMIAVSVSTSNKFAKISIKQQNLQKELTPVNLLYHKQLAELLRVAKQSPRSAAVEIMLCYHI